MTRAAWLAAATAQIRFPPDRKRVRRELEGHWEDAVDAARARGLTAAEAEAQALAAMGDPNAIAPELGRLHSPWLGRLWRFLRICTVVTLVILLAGVTDSIFRRNLLGRDLDPLEIPPEERDGLRGKRLCDLFHGAAADGANLAGMGAVAAGSGHHVHHRQQRPHLSSLR